MKLVLPDGLEIRQLYAAGRGQQVQIRRLNHKRDSLEDIFLKAMETAGLPGCCRPQTCAASGPAQRRNGRL